MASSSLLIRPSLPGTVGTPAACTPRDPAEHRRTLYLKQEHWGTVRQFADMRESLTFIVSLAVDLSPMVRMCSAFGPMNSMSWSAQMSTKLAFSDRNP